MREIDMQQKRWTNKRMDVALARLSACYETPAEETASMDARVRREVHSRFGSFVIPARIPIHNDIPAYRGILILFRPSVVAASFVVLVFAIAGVLHQSGSTGLNTETNQDRTSSEIVSAPAPFEPGSGIAVSVFGGPIAIVNVPVLEEAKPSSDAKPAPAHRTRTNARITPAQGVFTTWGSSVFSEDEAVRRVREGKSVLSS